MTDAALTPEEWVEFLTAGPTDVGDPAWAAMCLYGQEYGFTWEDVEHLENLIKREKHIATERPDNEYWQATCQNNIGVFRNLADRIAALLPPRSVDE